jgi:hypothetical protein
MVGTIYTRECKFKLWKTINSYNDGDILNQEDFKTFYTILQSHPSVISKIGKGVKEFFVKENAFKKKALFIRRVDDTEIDFSWIKCVDTNPKNVEYRYACLDAIKDMI